ncbi:uncharacterized protein LOC122947384 [Acropora millepora]|uniref:uncharacterized protein LOC122947384 n=1 Tax=Acropora millepora TaxID=45264 RepID=UPI001CF4F43A|nr:uncharacterized protein LOC122947384 [Acropora millepora]
MVAEKSGPSFASILTIVSIVIYTGGLVRIKVKFNKQKEKIHELESVVESMKTSNSDVARVQPRISLNSGPRYAIEGNTFTLPTYHVTGYPTPVVTWRKLSGHLSLGRVRYNNSVLQISQVRKEDSDVYTCSARNLLGKAKKNTMFVVVSLPRFTSKPPSKIVSMLRSTSDAGNCICNATGASVFDVQAVTALEIKKAALTSSNGSLDKKCLVKLNSFLAPVLQSSYRSRFVRCWRAKTDGWAASTFHMMKSSCDYPSSSKSFIYSLYNINGFSPVKLQIKSGSERYAIHRCFSYGPIFGGGHDIHISNNAASNRDSHTHCGSNYPLPQGYSSSGSSCRFYAGGGSYVFTPTDVEVFYETTT